MDKWLAFAELPCRGAFSSLPLPADVSVNISAKKPKMKAGAGAEELNVGVGGGEVGGEEAIFSNRTSVVRNRLPSLKPKQCLTLTPHHIFRVLHTHLGEPPTFMHRTKGLCVVRLSPKLGIVCGTAG